MHADPPVLTDELQFVHIQISAHQTAHTTIKHTSGTVAASETIRDGCCLPNNHGDVPMCIKQATPTCKFRQPCYMRNGKPVLPAGHDLLLCLRVLKLT